MKRPQSDVIQDRLLYDEVPEYVQERLEQLRDLVQNQGWASIQRTTILDGIRIQKWIGTMQAYYRAGRLAYSAIQLLESVPGWSWSPLARRSLLSNRYHTARLDTFAKYVRAHGGVRALGRHVVFDGVRLGGWWFAVRNRRRRGDLAAWLEKAVDEILDHDWARPRTTYDRTTEERFLLKLKRHLAVRDWNRIGQASALGRWVQSCRRRARERCLSDWLEAELKRLDGWALLPRMARMRANLAILTRVLRRGGWGAVLHAKTLEGRALAKWASARRVDMSRNRLAPWLARELAALPGWRWSEERPYRADVTERMKREAAALASFVETTGWRGLHRETYHAGVSLYYAALSALQRYQRGHLSRDVTAAFEAVPGWAWTRRLGQLTGKAGRQLKRRSFAGAIRRLVEHGGWDRITPETIVDGRVFGKTMFQLCRARRRGRVPPEITELFESIPGWSWSRFGEEGLTQLRHDRAEHRIRLLRELVSKSGWDAVDEACVIDGTSARKFVTRLKSQHNRGTLAHRLAEQLATIPGWSWAAARRPFGDGSARYRHRVELLRSYVTRDGWDSLTAQTVVEGIRLGVWWDNVKARRNASKLPEWIVGELERIPGIDWGRHGVKGTGFVERRNLALLREHVSRDGWDSISHDTRLDDHAVGRWLSAARRAHRRATLPHWIEEELQRIPGFSWDLQYLQYSRTLEELVRQTERVGLKQALAGMTADGGSMRGWVRRRKRERRAGRLDPALERRLAAIPGWSWGRTPE